MGNNNPKDAMDVMTVGPFPFTDPEYQISLQKYTLTNAALHQQLSAKHCKPDPKAKPKGHPLDNWTVGQLCTFIENACRSRYGTAFHAIKEVVDNFQSHLVDGMAVSQLRQEDWQVLCPYIGPRIWIMNQVQDLNKDGAGPLPPPTTTAANHPPKAEAHQNAASVLDLQRQRIQRAWESVKGSPAPVDADPLNDIRIQDLEDSSPRVEFNERPVSHEMSLSISEDLSIHRSVQDNDDEEDDDLLCFMNANPHPMASVRFADKQSALMKSQRPFKMGKSVMVVSTTKAPVSPSSSASSIAPTHLHPVVSANARPSTCGTRPGTHGTRPATCGTRPGTHATRPGTHGTRPGTRAQRVLQSVRLSFAIPDPSEDGEEVPSTSWLNMLFGRSRFSNHRLIDTPWRVDSSLSWAKRLWEQFVHRLLRIIFFLYTSLRVGLALHMLMYLVIPAACTTLSLYRGWQYEFAPTFFVTIIVFPLTFSLNAAFNRREQALQILANIKAAALALYLTSRSWAGTQGDLPPHYSRNTSLMIKGIFRNFGHYLTSVSEVDRATILGNIYQQYVDLAFQIDILRLSDLPPTLMGVPLNNMVNLMLAFEKLRVFSDYRTPCTIRSYFWSCMVVLSILMGPYTAYLANTYGLFYGYAVDLTFFWLLLCMNNIQTKLENPFSAYGEENAEEDDINLVTLRGGVEGPQRNPRSS